MKVNIPATLKEELPSLHSGHIAFLALRSVASGQWSRLCARELEKRISSRRWTYKSVVNDLVALGIIEVKKSASGARGSYRVGHFAVAYRLTPSYETYGRLSVSVDDASQAARITRSAARSGSVVASVPLADREAARDVVARVASVPVPKKQRRTLWVRVRRACMLSGAPKVQSALESAFATLPDEPTFSDLMQRLWGPINKLAFVKEAV